LATSETFDAFLGAKKWHALLHGHSYTANPLACAAALENARLVEGGRLVDPEAYAHDESLLNNTAVNTWYDPALYGGRGGLRPSFRDDDVRQISQLPGVKGAMTMGSVLSVELRPAFRTEPPVVAADGSLHRAPCVPAADATAHDRYYNNQVSTAVVALLRENGIYARPLGNVVYLMPSLNTPLATRQRLVRVLKRCITKAFYLRQPASQLKSWEAGFVPHIRASRDAALAGGGGGQTLV